MKTEIAQLKPSGQVAEDVEALRALLPIGVFKDSSAGTTIDKSHHDVLSRPAAKAQSYEAAVAELEAGKKLMAEHMRQRDGAVADLAAVVNAWRNGEPGISVVLEGMCSTVPVRPGAALLERMTKARDLRAALSCELEDASRGGDEHRHGLLSQRIADLDLVLGTP